MKKTSSRIPEAKIWRAAYGVSSGVEYSLFVAVDRCTANAYTHIQEYAHGLGFHDYPAECGRLKLRPEIIQKGTVNDILSGEYVGELEEGRVIVVPIKAVVGEVTFTKTPREK